MFVYLYIQHSLTSICYFTDEIGEDVVYDLATDPRIVEIKNHVDVEKNVEFQQFLIKLKIIIDKINIKKASWFDNIPASYQTV